MITIRNATIICLEHPIDWYDVACAIDEDLWTRIGVRSWPNKLLLTHLFAQTCGRSVLFVDRDLSILLEANHVFNLIEQNIDEIREGINRDIEKQS